MIDQQPDEGMLIMDNYKRPSIFDLIEHST
jgi:hypothetical protein